MGVKIAKHAIEADPENNGYRVLISDFYSCMEMWEEVEQVRKVMKDRALRKTMGGGYSRKRRYVRLCMHLSDLHSSSSLLTSSIAWFICKLLYPSFDPQKPKRDK
ncbi:pentatricopeptide repeat-containing family protein, partial [Striga asiatica]